MAVRFPWWYMILNLSVRPFFRYAACALIARMLLGSPRYRAHTKSRSKEKVVFPGSHASQSAVRSRSGSCGRRTPSLPQSGESTYSSVTMFRFASRPCSCTFMLLSYSFSASSYDVPLRCVAGGSVAKKRSGRSTAPPVAPATTTAAGAIVVGAAAGGSSAAPLLPPGEWGCDWRPGTWPPWCMWLGASPVPCSRAPWCTRDAL
mmetsp:Transcript_53511/g.164553  ORF Transcript_53511/g.164553 Transcript_53511/m.164553 type:complete len:204 (-) Transcript_53511:286-897(-)